jgi:hypothetical protein
MTTIVYAQGEAEVTVAANEKIAVFSWSPVQIYQRVGYPQFPTTWDLIETTDAGETYTSSAFASGATIRLNASAANAFYETGSAPVVGEPSPDITAAATPFVVAGLAAAQGGSAQVKGGTSSTAGNAGGAASILGGQPGVTGVGGAASATGGAGGATSGKGGAANVTGGAGTAGNGAGGSVVLTGGAKHGSGLDGGVFNRGTTQFRKQAAQVDKADGAETITGAQMVNGIVAFTVTTGRTLTTPTGANISAACPTDLAVGDSFDFTLITIGTGADDIATLTAGDGNVTFVGKVTVGPDTASIAGYGTWRFRNTGTSTWVGYRIG